MKFLLVLAVRIYQLTISPVIHTLAGPMSGCRFTPTCSQYFIDAVKVHGSMRGAWMGLIRIFRCNPWGGMGYDPVRDWERFVESDPSGAKLLAERRATGKKCEVCTGHDDPVVH